MSIEENKAIVRRMWEGLKEGNLAAFDELYGGNFVFHQPDGQELGLEAMKQFVATMLTAFPDHRGTVEDLIAEGDKVVARCTWTGTHKGALGGIPPTGRQVTVHGIEVVRLVGGKIVERWHMADRLGLMQQLGVMPSQ